LRRIQFKPLLGISLLLVLLAVACGGNEEDETAAAAGEPTAAEAEYLDSVTQAWELFGAKNEKFGALFGQAWPLPSLLFMALEEAGAGTAFEPTVAALDALTPPPRYEADHELMVAAAAEAVSLDMVIGRSMVDQDVTAFVKANVALDQASNRGALRLSSAVCRAANPPPAPPPYLPPDVDAELFGPGAPRPLCKRLRPDQGGEYGSAIYGLMSDLEVGFRPLVTFFIPLFASDQRFKILADFKPEIVRVLEETVASAKTLEPPTEFKQDHERLLQFLEDELEMARSIPQIASNRPVPAPGPPTEGNGPPPECLLKSEFSEKFLELVVVYFGDGPGHPCIGAGPSPAR
jgi:hypothetical protein